MLLVFFKLLTCCWNSEGVSLCKSACGFLKGDCLSLQQLLPLTQFLLGFAARSYGNLSSSYWNPELGGLVWGWDSSLLRCPSQLFIHHTWMWDQPIPPLLPVWMDVVSLITSLPDIHSTRLLMVLSEDCPIF